MRSWQTPGGVGWGSRPTGYKRWKSLATFPKNARAELEFRRNLEVLGATLEGNVVQTTAPAALIPWALGHGWQPQRAWEAWF